MTRKLMAFVGAVLSTYIVGVVLISQFNLARISGMGFPVGMLERVTTPLEDLVGMAGSYLPLITVGLLIAFVFTHWVLAKKIDALAILYPLAGFVAIIAIHKIMAMLLGLTAVAATRSLLGLLAQGVAGALGGYVYWWLSSPAESSN